MQAGVGQRAPNGSSNVSGVRGSRHPRRSITLGHWKATPELLQSAPRLHLVIKALCNYRQTLPPFPADADRLDEPARRPRKHPCVYARQTRQPCEPQWCTVADRLPTSRPTASPPSCCPRDTWSVAARTTRAGATFLRLYPHLPGPNFVGIVTERTPIGAAGKGVAPTSSSSGL